MVRDFPTPTWPGLTPEERLSAVKRCLLAGLSMAATARALGAPHGSIPSLIHRHRLRAWLADQRCETGQNWASLDRDGRIAAIRDGISAGLTSTEIARGLGATRNAVCGAAHRAGLRFAPAEVIDLAPHRAGSGTFADAPLPLSPAASFPPAAGDPEPGSPGETSPEDGADPVPESPAPASPEAASPDGIGFMDLVTGQCRFPLWQSPRPEFSALRFCAAPALPGAPWCAAHHGRCVITPDRQGRPERGGDCRIVPGAAAFPRTGGA